MIPPPTTHLQETARQSFVHKPTFSHQRDGCDVAGLNVGLKTVELQLPKGVSDHKPHSFGHEALTRVGRERIVAEGLTLKSPANHVVDVDDANDAACPAMDHEELAIGTRTEAIQILGELFSVPRLWCDLRTMQGAAAANRRKKRFAIP